MEKVKFDYDEENDSLFIYKSEEKVKGSVEIGDFILDIASNVNKIVGLEILNASKILSETLSPKVNKTVLLNIKKAFLRTQQKDNVIYVIYGIQSEVKEALIKEQTMMPVPVAISK